MIVKRSVTMTACCMLLTAASSGCSGLCYEATRNLVRAPVHYSYKIYDTLAPCKYRIWAHKTWRDVECQPGTPTSEDFRDGFIEGFVDHLDRGGCGEPPPMPPRKYWKKHHQTPAGHQKMQDWYAGFRLGASIAMESGYRRYVTIPPSMFGYHVGQDSSPVQHVGQDSNPALQPSSEMLPAPVPIEGATPHMSEATAHSYLTTQPVQLASYESSAAEPVKPMPKPVSNMHTPLEADVEQLHHMPEWVIRPAVYRPATVEPARPVAATQPLPTPYVEPRAHPVSGPSGSYVPEQSSVLVTMPAISQPAERIEQTPTVRPAQTFSTPRPLPFGPIPMTIERAEPAAPSAVQGRRLLRGTPLSNSHDQ